MHCQLINSQSCIPCDLNATHFICLPYPSIFFHVLPTSWFRACCCCYLHSVIPKAKECLFFHYRIGVQEVSKHLAISGFSIAASWHAQSSINAITAQPSCSIDFKYLLLTRQLSVMCHTCTVQAANTGTQCRAASILNSLLVPTPGHLPPIRAGPALPWQQVANKSALGRGVSHDWWAHK